MATPTITATVSRIVPDVPVTFTSQHPLWLLLDAWNGSSVEPLNFTPVPLHLDGGVDTQVSVLLVDAWDAAATGLEEAVQAFGKRCMLRLHLGTSPNFTRATRLYTLQTLLYFVNASLTASTIDDYLATNHGGLPAGTVPSAIVQLASPYYGDPGKGLPGITMWPAIGEPAAASTCHAASTTSAQPGFGQHFAAAPWTLQTTASTLDIIWHNHNLCGACEHLCGASHADCAWICDETGATPPAWATRPLSFQTVHVACLSYDAATMGTDIADFEPPGLPFFLRPADLPTTPPSANPGITRTLVRLDAAQCYVWDGTSSSTATHTLQDLWLDLVSASTGTSASTSSTSFTSTATLLPNRTDVYLVPHALTTPGQRPDLYLHLELKLHVTTALPEYTQTWSVTGRLLDSGGWSATVLTGLATPNDIASLQLYIPSNSAQLDALTRRLQFGIYLEAGVASAWAAAAGDASKAFPPNLRAALTAPNPAAAMGNYTLELEEMPAHFRDNDLTAALETVDVTASSTPTITTIAPGSASAAFAPAAFLPTAADLQSYYATAPDAVAVSVVFRVPSTSPTSRVAWLAADLGFVATGADANDFLGSTAFTIVQLGLRWSACLRQALLNGYSGHGWILVNEFEGWGPAAMGLQVALQGYLPTQKLEPLDNFQVVMDKVQDRDFPSGFTVSNIVQATKSSPTRVTLTWTATTPTLQTFLAIQRGLLEVPAMFPDSATANVVLCTVPKDRRSRPDEKVPEDTTRWSATCDIHDTVPGPCEALATTTDAEAFMAASLPEHVLGYVLVELPVPVWTTSATAEVAEWVPAHQAIAIPVTADAATRGAQGLLLALQRADMSSHDAAASVDYPLFMVEVTAARASATSPVQVFIRTPVISWSTSSSPAWNLDSLESFSSLLSSTNSHEAATSAFLSTDDSMAYLEHIGTCFLGPDAAAAQPGTLLSTMTLPAERWGLKTKLVGPMNASPYRLDSSSPLLAALQALNQQRQLYGTTSSYAADLAAHPDTVLLPDACMTQAAFAFLTEYDTSALSSAQAGACSAILDAHPDVPELLHTQLCAPHHHSAIAGTTGPVLIIALTIVDDLELFPLYFAGATGFKRAWWRAPGHKLQPLSPMSQVPFETHLAQNTQILLELDATAVLDTNAGLTLGFTPNPRLPAFLTLHWPASAFAASAAGTTISGTWTNQAAEGYVGGIPHSCDFESMTQGNYYTADLILPTTHQAVATTGSWAGIDAKIELHHFACTGVGCITDPEFIETWRFSAGADLAYLCSLSSQQYCARHNVLDDMCVSSTSHPATTPPRHWSMTATLFQDPDTFRALDMLPLRAAQGTTLTSPAPTSRTAAPLFTGHAMTLTNSHTDPTTAPDPADISATPTGYAVTFTNFRMDTSRASRNIQGDLASHAVPYVATQTLVLSPWLDPWLPLLQLTLELHAVYDVDTDTLSATDLVLTDLTPGPCMSYPATQAAIFRAFTVDTTMDAAAPTATWRITPDFRRYLNKTFATIPAACSACEFGAFEECKDFVDSLGLEAPSPAAAATAQGSFSTPPPSRASLSVEPPPQHNTRLTRGIILATTGATMAVGSGMAAWWHHSIK